MLAANTSYLDFWWTPVAVGAFVLAWVFGGGYFLQRALRKDVPRRRTGLGYFALASLLAGAAGAAGAAVVGLLILTIGDRAGANFRIPALVLALPTFAFMFFLVLHARYGLPLGDTLRRGALALLAVLVFAGAAGAAVLVPGLAVRVREARRARSGDQLKAIGRAILKYERTLTKSPKSLQDLVDQGLVRPKMLRCPSVSGQKIGYFYLPGPRGDTDTLRACEFTSPETEAQRWVLFSDHDATILPVGPMDFQDLLEAEQNKQFAKAFAEADHP